MNRFIHRLGEVLVGLLLATYGLAALMPRMGLILRSWSLGSIRAGGASLEMTAPTLMLMLLLLNASLGVDARQLRALAQRPLALVAGLAANLLLPLSFTLACATILGLWREPEELQSLLVGLAIVGAMPIAGSSTAWSQHAQGNLALSLGMVLGSTLLSPLTTPFGFHVVSWVVSGDYADDLHRLAGMNTQLFLLAGVVFPSLLGLVIRALVGERRLEPLMPWVRLSSMISLLLLNYANAAVALPQVVAVPDWRFLLLVFVSVSLLCALAFAGGHWVGRLVHAEEPERVSLMFGMGMNNNGTGLVLASAHLSHHPNILVAIVAYNLVQQLAAGVANQCHAGAVNPVAILWRRMRRALLTA